MENTTTNAGATGLEDSLRNMILRSNNTSVNLNSHPQQAHASQINSNFDAQRSNTQGHLHGYQNSPQRQHQAPRQNNTPGRRQHQSQNSSFPVNQQSSNYNQISQGGHRQNNFQASPHGHQHQQAGFRGSPGQGRGNGGFQQPQFQPRAALDPNAFQRGGQSLQHNLYNPRTQQQNFQNSRQAVYEAQAHFLEDLATAEVARVRMSPAELEEKERYLAVLSDIARDVCEADPENLPTISLESFGSIRSGFANAGSDMDLVIVVRDGTPTSACFSSHERGLPRSLERALLDLGYGARLLSKTRVPIIKMCQKPGGNLLSKLRAERERWDLMDHDKKYPDANQDDGADGDNTQVPKSDDGAADSTIATVANAGTEDGGPNTQDLGTKSTDAAGEHLPEPTDAKLETSVTSTPQKKSTWTRERQAGPLDFPKDGVGIQCDINFFNPLGLHNTQLLRCYSLCDGRVQPMVLFVKLWAKRRRVNSSYSGTLSSYGYVLMVLHYLINVAQPPVLPNLQHSWRPNASCTPQGVNRTEVDGWTVDFWRNEDEILAAIANGQMVSNRESLGSLLAGFFQYYSSLGGNGGKGRPFHWTREVLSLRTQGGILTKDQKGWVKAATEESEGKRIQHRYLFAIEDPFELTHNVARTVTHNGIVAIRDEFRRAFRILQAVGHGEDVGNELLAPLTDVEEQKSEVNGAGDAFANSSASKRAQGGHGPLPGTPTRPQQAPRSTAALPNMTSQDLFPALPPSTPQTKGRQRK
jgi:terminal uridylyltransferase